ncbi:FAD/NAD(P)-binding domain-containing protein [Clavulina sp. PMI_390]|nr:FAD/NAD(P)-binding domain-containing protein [Clavulina sp. PMI_390]
MLLTNIAVVSLVLLLSPSATLGNQLPLYSSGFDRKSQRETQFFKFSTPIKRVAVIGAGPTGLIHASTLIDEGFEVRLFERAPMPGGQWFYTDRKPVHASFPNRPIETAAYIPDIPEVLPTTRIYSDGDEGASNDWRMREHWNPSSVWARLWSTVPPFMMRFPGVEYAPDTPWRMQNRIIQRYVRQYASHIGLNTNDEESANITSYSTRVERVQKLPGHTKWTLTLRKVVGVPGEGEKRLRVDWWEEKFDAVVVATHSQADSAWVPPIPGLAEWAQAYPEKIYHGREYRRPEPLEGKNVLIVGGSVSGSGIGVDLAGHAGSISASMNPKRREDINKKIFLDWFPQNTTILPEIKAFAPLPRLDARSGNMGVRDAQITLVNGTVVSGFDHIILATGYRYSFPFLAGLHNSSIVGFEEPETQVAPIITDGTHHRSLHWTGHYIPDPTLGVVSRECRRNNRTLSQQVDIQIDIGRCLFNADQPWELGPYQAKGFARSWKGTARIPNIPEMWNSYPGAGHELFCHPGSTEFCHRLFLTWLNDASLEFGGKMLDTLPSVKDMEALAYYLSFYQGRESIGFVDRLKAKMQTPRAEWPARNESEWTPASGPPSFDDDDRLEPERWDENERGELRAATREEPYIPHWAEISDRW